MSQVEMRQQDFPTANGHGNEVQKSAPKKGGNANRQSDDNRPHRSRGGDRGSREGANRRGRRDGDRGEKVLREPKTIHIGRVFTDDLDGSALSEKLKEQRIKYLRDVFEQFGVLESFEPQIGDNYVLLTFEKHTDAENALKALKNREEVDALISRIEDKLAQSKLPKAVCPQLQKYRYSWSDRQNNKVRSAGGKGVNLQLPKTVVAKKASDQQQVSSPTVPQQTGGQQQPQQQQPKPKKERKPKADREDQQQANTQQSPAVKMSKKAQQQEQVNALSPKQQGADDLQREAERARLTQDLQYLRQQQQHVTQELNAESDRCRARDERINRLSEELSRVRQQEQFLEGQLKAEQNWKQTAEERIAKLTEEVTHFVQEQKQVEKRLSTVEQQLGAANGL